MKKNWRSHMWYIKSLVQWLWHIKGLTSDPVSSFYWNNFIEIKTSNVYYCGEENLRSSPFPEGVFWFSGLIAIFCATLVAFLVENEVRRKNANMACHQFQLNWTLATCVTSIMLEKRAWIFCWTFLKTFQDKMVLGIDNASKGPPPTMSQCASKSLCLNSNFMSRC